MINKNYTENLNILYQDFKNRYSNIHFGNWVSNLNQFLDLIIETEVQKDEQRILQGWLASLCEKAYFVAAHNKNHKTIVSFEKKFEHIINSKKLPIFLYSIGPILCGKRQPSFVESIDSTFERYRVMERLSTIFNSGVEGIIIGGSMSYGPFYSVRNNVQDKDFSDIDGLVVVNDSFFDDNWSTFLKNTVFLKDDKELFFERMKIFKNYLNLVPLMF